jgi:tripartite-type tricarboxylate transporter receptor subunit TctC
MTLPRRGFLQLAVAATALPSLARVSRAESYPARPVRILVATSAGGTTDLVARIIAQRLGERLGQSFVVENRPGGGNNIGTEAAVRATPDGYTLFMANTVNAINTTLYQNLAFNFTTDMAPVANVVRSVLLVNVHPSVPAKTIPELIAYAKANPGKVNMGSGGTGSTGHVSGELFAMMAGIKMVHVPYRGESMAMADLIKGQVQVVVATTGSSIQFVKGGQVHALAVTGTTRWPSLPDVPPLAEFLPGYEASSWSGLCAPKDTPAPVIALLNREVNAALEDAELRMRLAEMGSPADTKANAPADFGRTIVTDTEKWAKVIRFSGAKAN